MAKGIQPEGRSMIFGILAVTSLLYYVITGYDLAFLAWMIFNMLMLMCL